MITGANALQEIDLVEIQEILSEASATIEFTADGSFENHEAQVLSVLSEKFRMVSLDQVNWGLRKLTALSAEWKKTEALAHAELDRINAWLDKKARANSQSVEFLNRLIMDYAAGRRADDPKYKGETTPYGRVGFRKQAVKWTYADEAATVGFLEGVETLKDHVQTVKSIANKTKLKTAIDVKQNVFVKDGEIVDVAHATPGGWVGMQYVRRETEMEDGSVLLEIVDTETGEVVEDVSLMGCVAVAEGTKVIPGINVTEQADAIDVKPEV